MSSTPDWEKLFDRPVYCSTCARDITTESCDCENDLDLDDTFPQDDPVE